MTLQSAVRRALTLVACALPIAARAQNDGPPPKVRATIRAIERMMEGTSESSLQAFASTRISPAYLARVSRDSLMRALKALRAAPGGEVGGVSVEREGTGLRMSFMAQRPFGLHLELDDEGLIREITMGAAATRSSMPASPDDALWDAMTWENLTATVQRAAQQGFRGTVLARRDGKEVARLALGTIDGAGSRATSCAASFSLPRA